MFAVARHDGALTCASPHEFASQVLVLAFSGYNSTQKGLAMRRQEKEAASARTFYKLDCTLVKADSRQYARFCQF